MGCLFACGCFAIDGAGGVAGLVSVVARRLLRVLQGGFMVALGSRKALELSPDWGESAHCALLPVTHSGRTGDVLLRR